MSVHLVAGSRHVGSERHVPCRLVTVHRTVRGAKSQDARQETRQVVHLVYQTAPAHPVK